MFFAVAPRGLLRPFVRKYVHVETNLPDSVVFWAIPARSVTCIEFTFGQPYTIQHLDRTLVETTYASTLIGAKSYQRIRLDLRGHIETFAILFEPTGLQRLFSLPGSEIVNEHYEAGDVLGPAMKEVRSRMAETTCFRDRVLIADEYLTGLLPRVNRFSAIDAAAREILCAQGCVRIDDVARKNCLSVRQFERNFLAKIGIRPKLYARIVRFEAAIERRAADPSGNWTTIAHQLGYHDQMHMIHDFRLLSGENPTVLVKQLGPIGSDAIQVI